ncbi:MAG: hypothetical protein WD097_02175 [Balneolales bacterium]
MKKLLIFLFAFNGAMLHGNAQGQITLKKDLRLAVSEQDSVVSLDPWIIPETFQVRGDTIILPPKNWTLYPVKGEWSWDVQPQSRLMFDSLFFRYEVRPVNLPVSVYERELIRIDTLDGDVETDDTVQITRRPLRQDELFGDTQLQRNGNLRRGIVVGSHQDFTMESGLRLDISGHITDDIEVVASLTDRSTPIQPDGTTQTLREFDQVYIRMQHELGMLQMGDVDVKLDQSRFAVINRRMQGVNIQTGFKQYGDYLGAAAVIRGQYREMRFNGEDGVQGPYRLTGAENEQFIIVLAGSERVYINGQLMVRGEENDYVIDYGLGEVTFTSNRIITDHSRIIVDFQYMKDAYTRTLLAAEAEEVNMLNGRVTVGASAIREADNVNLSTQYFLSESERDVLSSAGDDSKLAVVSGADSVGFRRDADFLLYSKTDTLYQEVRYEIFEHIPGDSSSVYRVVFSRVPDGEGDYRRVGRAANGILYEWAGPGMGNYMPERRLSRPVEQNMIALRSRVRATSHLDFFSEWSGSYFDRNRLSPVDDHNNEDMSFLIGMELKPFETRLGTIRFDAKGRYEGEHFAYFDRVREVEFNRRWNLSHVAESDEKRIESEAGWLPTNQSSLHIAAGILEHNEFDGIRGDARLISTEEGLPHVEYFLERVESDDRRIDEQGSWWRQQGRVDYDISMSTGSLQPELEFEKENRLQKNSNSDSLTTNSFRFFEVGPGLYYQISDAFRVGSSVRYRKDSGVIDGEFTDESYGITQRYVFDYRRDDLFQTKNLAGLRQRRFEEIFRLDQQRLDSRGILLRSVTDYRPWDRFVETHFLYDANTERQPLIQEAFIDIGPGMGQYIWIDSNEDGVQQVDEFFPEQSPNEGIFIKHLVPSDELFSVIALRARWRTTVDPSRLIDSYDAQYSELLDFLSGLRWQSVIDIQEENSTDQVEDIYLLRLHKFRDDSLTISGRFHIEQDVEFFRNRTRYEFRLTADRMLSQNRRTSGVERQKIENIIIRGGGRLTGRYRVSASMTLGRNTNISEGFTSRNFLIYNRAFSPRLDIRWYQSVQSGVGMSYLRRDDRFPANSSVVRGVTMHTDTRITLGRKILSTLRVEHRSFELSGGPSTSIGEFELTDGAGLGNTWSWSLQADYRISTFLRAGMQYDGRTLTNRPLIQTLRFNINAVF